MIKKINMDKFLEILIYIISFTILIDKSPVVIYGSYVRLYQVVSIVFILIIIYKILKKEMKIKVSFFDKLIVLWMISLVLSGISCVFFEDYIKAVIGQCYLIIFMYSIYIYMCNVNSEIKDRIYKFFVYGLVLGAIVGIFQFLLFSILNINIGVTHISLGLARPIGLMRETNWYSLVCLLLAVCMTVQLFSKNYFINYKIDITIFLISLSGIFLSMTRSAFLAFGITYAIIFLLTNFNKNMIKFAVGCIATAMVILIGIYIYDSNTAMSYINRLNPLKTATTDKGALDSRKATIRLSIDKFKENPILGNGAGTIGKFARQQKIREKYAHGGELNVINAGPNIIVNSFYESGIIGGGLFLLLFGYLIKKLFNICKINSGIVRVINLGLISSILIFSLYNNSIRLGVFWFIVAMCYYYINELEYE